jgi:hypothetical protein
MRVDEHLFQGFFGINKKQDSAKYYHERVDKLKGLDSDLDKCIDEFQKVLVNHNKKITAYHYFLTRIDKPSLQSVMDEINKLEGMFDDDEIANDTTRRYALKIEEILKILTKNEECIELQSIEQDTMSDLKELHRMIASIKPLWEQQLEFVKKNDEEILTNKNNIKILTDIFKEESDIMKMEESLLKKIDLKTGNILRKTTLKLRGIEETKDMNMNYRDIKHIR